MTDAGDDLIRRISDLFDDRPVRWAQNVAGDYDGRDRTLEVFNADPADQADLFRRLRPIRKEMEAFAGGPVIVIFHTKAESARLYSDFMKQVHLTKMSADLPRRQGGRG